jgi:hypothetical protein
LHLPLLPASPLLLLPTPSPLMLLLLPLLLPLRLLLLRVAARRAAAAYTPAGATLTAMPVELM